MIKQYSKSKIDIPLLCPGKGENHVVEMKWDELTSRVQMKMSDGFSLQVIFTQYLLKLYASRNKYICNTKLQ